MRMGLTDREIGIVDVVKEVRRPEAGAIVVFLGTVRAEPGLKGLDLESYEDMAVEKLGELKAQTLDRFSVLDVAIEHRVGPISIGEDIVVIAVSAAHRADAFAACRFVIDELKVTVPIWKKEIGPGTWVQGDAPKDGKGATVPERTKGMVDISGKDIVHRRAVAEGRITLSSVALEAIRSRTVKKGDVLEVARMAAIGGVKLTPTVVPLCHPVLLTAVHVDFEVLDDGIRATCAVEADYRTGVEMEALTGVTVALLTVWDMVKYLEKDEAGQYPSTRIQDVRVLRKEKG